MCKTLITCLLLVVGLMALRAVAVQELENLTEISKLTNVTEASNAVAITASEFAAGDENSSSSGSSNITAKATAATRTTTTSTKGTTTTPGPNGITTTSDSEKESNTNNSNASAINAAATTTMPPPSGPYCAPSLCETYNGTHTYYLPHIACQNPGNFAATCGAQPHLLYMSERRRNLIVDLHNLARSRIASGQVPGYQPATHMPLLKWDPELEHLATLHAKRCKFSHDLCRNTPRFQYSGQNIGYYWVQREIKSHSRRMKNFIVNWYKEHKDANQSYIDAYDFHPEGKKIGHFTQMVADRAHLVGCAAIRYHEPDEPFVTKFLMTCNYDYTNILGEPVYQTGPTASKCVYKRSRKYPALCDWKTAVYDYEVEETRDTAASEDGNLLDNSIPL